MPITAAEDHFRAPGSAAEHYVRHYWPAAELRVDPQPECASDPPLLAYVNDGRWVVRCECGSAQLASRNDHRYFCLRCWNASVERRWRRVEWPSEPAAIEAVLLARPPAHRHWQPHETLAELERENLAHGFPTDARALIATPDGLVGRL